MMDANISRKRKHSDGAKAHSFQFLTAVPDEAARRGRFTLKQNETTGSEIDSNARQQYRGISVNGWARVHMGNVYAETVNYYSYRQLPPQIGDSPQVLKCKAFIQALCYQNMKSEIAGAELCHDGPGNWLLSKPSDLEWVLSNARGSQSRGLWIRGHPASGKSVLLKRIADAATKRMPDYVVLSFFFSKSDESHKRSVEGMYRAVLHQLLDKIPMLRSLLHLPPSPIKSRFLAVDILKHLIRDAVLQLRGERLLLIIDALDECDEGGVRDAMRFFAGLDTLTQAWSISFHTCFSSRRYPDNSSEFLGRSEFNATSQPENDRGEMASNSRKASRGSRHAAPQITEPWLLRECLWLQVLLHILYESRDPHSTLLQLGVFNRALAWNHPFVLSGLNCEAHSQQLSLPVIYCGFLRKTNIIEDLLSAMRAKSSVAPSISEEADRN